MAYTKIDRLKKELDTAISEGNFELALEVINDMIKLDHQNDQYWNSRGVVLSKLGRIEESLQAFDQGLELNPEGSRIWYSKGCVLMDKGKPRAALACFYKTLDLDPAFDKARDRFNRCLDDLVLLQQTQEEHGSLEEPVHRAPSGTIPGPGEPRVREVEEERKAPDIIEPRAEKRRGTYLDDDMFSEPSAEEEDEEDWGEEEEDEEEAEYEDEEEDDDDEEEEWDEEVDTEDEAEYEDEEEEEEDDDDEEEEQHEFIVCRCGSRIYITSDRRPYRFECDDCGRSGTLRS
ncbi:MAG: tetratricopeptide repeat protein [Thermoplasmatota archaeon]